MTVGELREKLFECPNQDADIEIYVCGRISGILEISDLDTDDETIYINTKKISQYIMGEKANE